MNIFDDEQSWHEAQNEYMDRYAPVATMADAHREWHLNSGVPMGTPGCPQDACHPIEDYLYGQEDAVEYVSSGTIVGGVEYDMSTIPHLWDYDEPDPYAGTGGYDDGIPF